MSKDKDLKFEIVDLWIVKSFMTGRDKQERVCKEREAHPQTPGNSQNLEVR